MNNRYIIAAIDPQNGKHNFYHDEMRGSIATIVSAEVGDGAIIRYIPEYDDRYHHVTTSTVKSAEEKDGVLVIETSNTIYTLQAIKEAEFVSVWDGGFAVTTDCKVNMVTKEVFDIEVSAVPAVPADDLDVLDEQYIVIDGERYHVFDEETIDGYWYEG